MAQLVARWRRSNLVILITLKKETILVKRKLEGAEEKLCAKERETP